MEFLPHPVHVKHVGCKRFERGGNGLARRASQGFHLHDDDARIQRVFLAEEFAMAKPRPAEHAHVITACSLSTRKTGNHRNRAPAIEEHIVDDVTDFHF